MNPARPILSALLIASALAHAAEHDLSVGNGHFDAHAQLQTGPTGDVITLPGRVHVEIETRTPLNTDSGSLVAWVMPLWDVNEGKSHVILTLRWQGKDQSYLALSQGWWEPGGNDRLHFVLSNQDFVFCEMPGQIHYAIFAPKKWTMLAATWEAGRPGYVRLYVDGQKICDRRVVFAGGRHSADKVYLGSDQGATDQRERFSDFEISGLEFVGKPLNDAEVLDRYRRGGGSAVRKWLSALIGVQPPRAPQREARAMFDEDIHWTASRLETDRTLQRLKRAGFNVYVPCVWNGAEAVFANQILPLSAAYRARLNHDDDPLQYLILAAHRAGIAVHLWFDVARRDTALLPAEYTEGAPSGAFNVQNAAFRTFVTAVIRDAAVRYDADGVNLDYIRSMGVCSSNTCEKQYAALYGRSLRQDWRDSEQGKSSSSLIAWNSNAVSSIVYGLSRRLRAEKPNLFLSVDTIPFDHSRLDQGVDVSDWVANGAIDSVVYMAYDTPLDVWGVTEAWRRLPRDKLLVLMRNFQNIDDQYGDLSGEEIPQYVNLVRSQWPGAGVGFYHYPHLTSEQVAALERGPFAHPAASTWVRRGIQ